MTSENGTADRIVDVVEDLMMSRSFNAISYQDIAARIGIRKASIHYHFPAKADLGEAVIRRYIDKIAVATPPLDALPAAEFPAAFEGFLAVFAEVAKSPARVCLGGVLGAEYETLPEGMREQVRRFYRQSQDWLTALLEAGRPAGAFRFSQPADTVARTIFSAMEGSLIIGRALGDPAQIAAVADAARMLAGAPPPR